MNAIHRLLFGGCVALAAASAAAAPGLPDECSAPADLVATEAPLPRLRAALRGRDPVRVIVLGTGSAEGAVPREEAERLGAEPDPARGNHSARLPDATPDSAWPARFAAALQAAHPGRRIDLRVIAKPGASTADLRRVVDAEVLREAPALLVLQVGIADARLGRAVPDFGADLEAALDLLARRRIDVLLVDMQYGATTALFINTAPYRAYLRWIARSHDLPYFRRHELMQHWFDNGSFEPHPADVARARADKLRMDACVGGQLAALVEMALDSP
ncbi:SGNH/GDSL hydrolase family protein [Derxia lacustris]|uniref:SGNH/GDSL hydrolase family protein n=1 Tax=Derxia lacustris TaxID=764842 RepID=UPI000A1786C3|nr:GDSL-type esterase/lipase family protein [Derxia lacustris]